MYPTKFPRIRKFMSEAESLVGDVDVQISQVEALIGRISKVRPVQLEGPHRSHNPKGRRFKLCRTELECPRGRRFSLILRGHQFDEGNS